MATLDRFKWHAIGGLVLSIALLTASLPTTFAFDRPYHSGIVVFLSCAAAILGLAKYSASHERDSTEGQQKRQIPLHGVGQQRSVRRSSPHVRLITGGPLRVAVSREHIRFGALVATFYLRFEILRLVIAHVQCASTTKQPWLVVVFAIREYRRARSQESGSATSSKPTLGRWLQRRQLWSTLLVGVGAVVVLATARNPRSSYICATALPYRWLVPCLQWLGVLLDFVIVHYGFEMLRDDDWQSGMHVTDTLRKIAGALAATSSILGLVSLIHFAFIASPIDRILTLEIPTIYYLSIAKLAVLSSVAFLSCIILVVTIGVVSTVILSTVTAVIAIAIAQVWSLQFPYALPFSNVSFVATGIVLLGFALYLSTNEASTDSQINNKIFEQKPTSWVYMGLLLLFLFYTSLWASFESSMSFESIDYLIADAKERHEKYKQQASQSTTVTEAAQRYRERYNQHPPPGFHHWFEYAKSRNSVIIDDYDSIYDDLLPFYAVPPAEIREKTWRMISNPWHDASGISIRNGSLEISPLVMPTHRWMLEGVAAMMKPFVEWLPDMDLAFNLNDECRVAVPYETLQPMREAGRHWQDVKTQPTPNFSPDRAQTWKPSPEKPIEEQFMTARSWQRIFSTYGAVGCPPDSLARTQRHWDLSRLCLSCAAPHSLGPFLANWTLAADICHQPDLADLHGLYLSPAAFKGTHELYPIFSQSKAAGFNDILYPSAWNYNDKVKYNPSSESGSEEPDPPFSEKLPALFWRGSATEGVSSGRRQWQGMSRQRFTHLSSSSSVKIPTGLEPWQPLPPSTTSHESSPIPLNISLTSLARCNTPDCTTQETEFSPLPPSVPFQSHWKYKFLLDLDGAGFSGRFIPFLQSRSVVFKAALVREWWEGRLEAWVHFVPVDLRGWGLRATLEGLGLGDGTRAERIAQEGREWVGKVMRKEDMEVYLFRVLLEWGRVTDERRGELGWVS